MATSRASIVAFLQEKFNRYYPEVRYANKKIYRPILSPAVLRTQCQSISVESLLDRNLEEQNALNFLLAQPITTWDYSGSYAAYPIVLNPSDSLDQTWASLPRYQQEKSFRQYKLELFKVLLEKFPNTPEGSRALHSALSHPDQQGQTTLHMIIKESLIDVLNLLLPRIEAMTFSQKKELACMTNALYQSIFHLSYLVDERTFHAITTAFGQDVMREAMLVKDLQRNTILHGACLTPHGPDRFAKIQYYCGQLEHQGEPGAESKLESQKYLVSEFNLNDTSLLHVCCKNPSNSAELDEKTISLLTTTIGKDSFFRIAMQKDSDGLSALDCAVEKKSHAMVTAIFSTLTIEMQQEMILQQDKKNYTALHYALISGEKILIETIIRKLTATQLFSLHSSLAAPLKVAAVEGKVTALYHRLIAELIPEFLLVEHLLKQAAYIRVAEQSILYRFSSMFAYFQKTAPLSLKLEDAQNCFRSVEEKTDMPRQLPQLHSDTGYQAKRSNLRSAEKKRLQECAEYFTTGEGFKRYQVLGEDVINTLFNIKGSTCENTEVRLEASGDAPPLPSYAPIYYAPLAVATPVAVEPQLEVERHAPSAPDIMEEIAKLPSPPSRPVGLFAPAVAVQAEPRQEGRPEERKEMKPLVLA